MSNTKENEKISKSPNRYAIECFKTLEISAKHGKNDYSF